MALLYKDKIKVKQKTVDLKRSAVRSLLDKTSNLDKNDEITKGCYRLLLGVLLNFFAMLGLVILAVFLISVNMHYMIVIGAVLIFVSQCALMASGSNKFFSFLTYHSIKSKCWKGGGDNEKVLLDDDFLSEANIDKLTRNCEKVGETGLISGNFRTLGIFAIPLINIVSIVFIFFYESLFELVGGRSNVIDVSILTLIVVSLTSVVAYFLIKITKFELDLMGINADYLARINKINRKCGIKG